MSIYLGTQLLSGVATNTISNAHTLLDFKWTDHELTDQSWLRADTFGWQDGTVYSDAYNHLVADNSGGTSASETIGSYTITYVVASDGHKITTDETTVANIYSETGVAWYYVLDTVNQRFKLPRTKYGFTGLRDAVGKYVAAGLPNITGSFSNTPSNTNAYSGAFRGGGSGQTFGNGNDRRGSDTSFDASLSNTIYGSSTTVQPPATQMYLYFYVGQFSQSATEQTAGLNSELFNGKIDLPTGKSQSDIDFIVESYQNGTSWYRIYKSGWVEQGGMFDAGSDKTSNSGYTVTLPVEMSNTNYYSSVCMGGNTNGGGYGAYTSINTPTKTTTSIGLYVWKTETSYRYIYWEVKGMSA